MGTRVERETQPSLTAVSHDAPTHSPFSLGVRAFRERQDDGELRDVLRWAFTVSPIDGSQTATLEWRHVSSTHPIDSAALNQWTLIVGVCDTDARCTHLYIPSLGDHRTDRPTDEWNYWWSEEGALQVGCAKWLSRVVDHWPGSIGEVRAFTGALTMEDALNLYVETRL